MKIRFADTTDTVHLRVGSNIRGLQSEVNKPISYELSRAELKELQIGCVIGGSIHTFNYLGSMVVGMAPDVIAGQFSSSAFRQPDMQEHIARAVEELSKPKVKLSNLKSIMPSFYTDRDGGEWKEWEPKYGKLAIIDLNLSTYQIVLMNYPDTTRVHSLLFEGFHLLKAGARWDCINGWTTPLTVLDWIEEG